MNLRRKAADALDGIGEATEKVTDAAALQTIVLGVLCIGVMVAIALGLGALGR